MHPGNSSRRRPPWTLRVGAAAALALLLAVAPSLLHAAAGPPAAPPAPQIELTSVPPYGSSAPLQGRVTGADASSHAVAVYTRILPYGWSTKPTAAAAVTKIGSNGTWTCNISTAAGDQYATEIIAFLIPAGYKPPVMDLDEALPAMLYTYPYAWTIRYQRLRFANCDWMAKRVNDLTSPGPNYFSDNAENLWLDTTGQLHLKLTKRSGYWYCSEVVLDRTLGYGRYALTVAGGLKGMNRNAVLSCFTWDDVTPDYNYREMDVEFSRWGDDRLPNARYMVQPWYNTGNTYQFELDPAADPAGVTTHELIWDTNQASFRSYAGPFTLTPPATKTLASWTYKGADLRVAGRENLHVSLWLIGGLAPSDGKPVEVTLASATYLPCEPNAVHRFWSPTAARHFYTISASEKAKLQQDAKTWTYEGIAFWTIAGSAHAHLAPVHRFWSDRLADYFYTIDEAEKTKLTTEHANTWTYEGAAFYAWPDGRQPPGTSPVHRFVSTTTGSHFYTANESEKTKLIENYPTLWTYEGVAWHAYCLPSP